MAACQHEKPSQRMVSSGRVYRQMFDAEVQLVKSLEETRMMRCEKPSSDVGCKDSIPVVRMKLPAVGMMDERQLRWLEEFPNEPYTENPVVYKFCSNNAKLCSKETEADLVAKEIHSLPDEVVAMKVGSNIIERVAECKRQRHEAALEDLYHNLGIISTEMEPQVASLCEAMVCHLKDSELAVKNIMSEITPEEENQKWCISAFNSVWEKVCAQIAVTKCHIEVLDVDLAQLEKERMEKVKEEFENVSMILECVGHLVLPDLQRLLDKECQIINQTVLANKRAYADLHCRLMVATVEQEKNAYVQWLCHVDHWRGIHRDHIIKQFVSFMQSDEIVRPTSIKAISDEMIERQRSLNQKRIDLVSFLSELQPPSSTKTLVAQQHQKIIDFSKELDCVNQLYFNKLCAEYERICQLCLIELEKVKIDLVKSEACTEDEVTEIVNCLCLPLIGEQQAKYEQMMEEMDKCLEQHSAIVLGRLKVLFMFCQHIAHCWDLHEINLSKLEKELKEQLEKVRLENELTNQESESNLDAVLDQLRQDANESFLQQDLKKALAMLTDIEAEYTEFQEEQSEIMTQYPAAVHSELSAYDQRLCTFLGLEHEEEEWDANENVGEINEDAVEINEDAVQVNEDVVQVNEDVVQVNEDAFTTNEYEDPEQTCEDVIASNEAHVEIQNNPALFITKRGTKYKSINNNSILIKSDEGKGDQQLDADVEKFDSPSAEQIMNFLPETSTSVMEIETCDLAPYLKSIDIEEKMVKETIAQIQMNMLEHLDVWMAEAVERSNAVVEAKNAELKNEFDIRMHLHEPRAKRIEFDIHNVRAAEIVLHSERVLRHCKGAERTIAELKQKCAALTEDHDKLADKFVKDIEKLETVFKTATKSSKLVELSQQLKVVREKFMDEIRMSNRQFCQQLDRNIQILNQSTAQLIKSFKLFSEGGNFCPAEVEEFRGRLNKLSAKIDQCEGSIMGDLESIEAKRLDQALKVTKEFEDRYKYHMVDLVYLEKISRWMLNTQAKIKGEVSLSNTSANAIASALYNFEKRLDACECPSPDKQQVVPSSLVTELIPIYELVQNRSVYLQCLKDPLSVLASPAPSSSFQGISASGVNVVNVTVGFNVDGLQCTSKPGKHQLDDPSVTVIRSLLRSKRLSSKEAPIAEGGGTKRSPSSSAKSKKKVVAKAKPKKTRNTSSKGKFDKSLLVFGEEPEEGEDTHFKGRIKQLLRGTLIALLTISDLYYQQKGIRQVTKPDVIKDNFDDCAEVLVKRCQLYKTQCEDYHNECLQEFHQQLSCLEALAGRVPCVVLHDLKQSSLKKLQTLLNEAEQEHDKIAEDSDRAMRSHEQELRPYLGHPQNQDKLEDLSQREEERCQMALLHIEQHTTEMNKIVQEQSEAFLQDLARKSENLLVQFDNMLVVDDILAGRQTVVKLTSGELIRRHKEGQSLYSNADLAEIVRGKNTWPGLTKDLPGLAHIMCKETKRQPSSTSTTDDKLKMTDESADSRKSSSTSTTDDKLKMTDESANLRKSSSLSATDDKLKMTDESANLRKSSSSSITGDELKLTDESANVRKSSSSITGDKLKMTDESANLRKSSSSSISCDKLKMTDESANLRTASITTMKTTLGHNATMEARDAAYEEFKAYTASALATIEDDSQTRKRAEERLFEKWRRAVEKVKTLYD